MIALVIPEQTVAPKPPQKPTFPPALQVDPPPVVIVAPPIVQASS